MGEATILFRADASRLIGTGHARRCATVARELSRRGFDVAFAGEVEGAEFAPQLAAGGWRFLPVEPGDDGAGLRDFVGGACAALIVDHYGLGAAFESAQRGWARRIVVFDDLADRRHDCDLLIDQTPGRAAAEYRALVPAGCRALTGAAFALLDARFAARRSERAVSPQMRRVLVSFGGADVFGATRLALDALSRARTGAEIDVVLGLKPPDFDEIAGCAARLDPPGRLRVAVDDMAALLAECDLAIGAGGVSALERCCVGLPSIIVSVADNQIENARAMHDAGAALDLGAIAGTDVDALAAAIRSLARDPERRAAMTRAGQKLCDGQGLRRVCDAISAIATRR